VEWNWKFLFHFTQHFDGRSTNISYLDFSLKPAVFSCLTNALDPPPIALESCSRAQMDWQSSNLHSKKIFWLGLQIFYEWHHKGSSFWAIWLMLPGLRPNLLAKAFRWSFHWKLCSSLSILSLWSTFKCFFEPLIDFLAFFLSTDLKIDKLSSAVGGGARALVRQPKAVVF